MSAQQIAVLGAGKLAQAMLALLARGENRVRLWARRPRAAQALAAQHEGVHVFDDVAEACRDAAVVAFAVPAAALSEVAAAYGPQATGDQVVLHACRGFAPGCLLPHQALRRECCVRKIGVLGGPLYIEDLAPGRPLIAVLASRFPEVFELGAEISTGTPLRLHASYDLIGVEVAGAISNVANLAAGIALGLGLGDTAAGVVLAQGLAAATHLGVALGAKATTFAGLAGVGDLIPRPVTSTRRHRELGIALGRGTNAGELLAQGASALEGVLTAKEARAMARRRGMHLPLIEAVFGVLYAQADAHAAIEDVLRHDLELGA